MRRHIHITAFLMLFGFLGANAQVEVGFGTSWDYGIDMAEGTGYTPYGRGQTSMFTIDGYIRIPLNCRIAIYPTYQYSIPMRTILLENPQGDYIPEGYGVSLPYADDANFSNYYYSDDYYTLTSEADVFQTSIGSFLMLDVGAGVEIGTGLFVRKKETRIFDFMAYDEYYYYGSTGTDTDDYIYSDTYEYWGPSEEKVFVEKLTTVPLVLQYTQYFDGSLYMGGSFIYWTGTDNYMSFRYTMGVNF